MKKANATSTLGKSCASQQPILNIGDMSIKPGYSDERIYKYDFRETIKDCRHFYHTDSISATVLNRLCDIGITSLRNRKKSKNNKTPISDEIMAYYNYVADVIKPFLKQLSLEYLLHGLVIPEATFKRTMGVRATDKLGRTRYYFPEYLYCRNIDNIELVKLPSNAGRLVYLKIPSDEIKLIKTKGKNSEKEKALYQYYADNYPEYVSAIEKGETKFLLSDVIPLYRKLTSYNVYPIPYLTNALSSLKHKARIKDMDLSITSRVIEAVRQIKVGNDEYPADDDDLRAEQQAFISYGNSGEKIFNYFTNHTVEIKWSYPPFEMLLSDSKYIEPNREIFMALGFPRLWATGETEKSNASDNQLAIIGPMSTINDVRDNVLLWVKAFYEKLAELNNFDRVPEPYLSNVNLSDVANLIQYGRDYAEKGAISLDTMSALYGTDYETELEQRLVEVESEKEIAPVEIAGTPIM